MVRESVMSTPPVNRLYTKLIAYQNGGRFHPRLDRTKVVRPRSHGRIEGHFKTPFTTPDLNDCAVRTASAAILMTTAMPIVATPITDLSCALLIRHEGEELPSKPPDTVLATLGHVIDQAQFAASKLFPADALADAVAELRFATLDAGTPFFRNLL